MLRQNRAINSLDALMERYGQRAPREAPRRDAGTTGAERTSAAGADPARSERPKVAPELPVYTRGPLAPRPDAADAANVPGLDRIALSAGARGELLVSRAQFEVNYQAFKSIQSADGQQIRELTFSFQASFEVIQLASGGEPIELFGPGEAGADADPFARLQEFFSSENTANRVLDFALAGYAQGSFAEGGDTEEARGRFAAFIGDAIRSGVQAARSLLGTLPDEVSAGVDRTQSLVDAGLAQFIKLGISPEREAPGAALDRSRVQRAVLAAEVQRATVLQTAYDAAGKGKDQGNAARQSTLITSA